ncbi:MAG: amidohydrolase family protein, partial [Verrucomicrobiae bacterium]|nr:amidohydrolase family protein [Verrucomicrobiae bacterium]
DARVAKHPEMTFVAFHLGSMSHDVGMVDSRLAIYPNMYVGVAARVQFLMRQPSEKVRDFFIKYQDRILYGTDLSIENWRDERSAPETAEERARFKERSRKMYEDQWNYFSSDGMATYLGYTTRGLNLPTEVLEKFYYKNAQKVIPGL